MYQHNYLMARLCNNAIALDDKAFIRVFEQGTVITYKQFFSNSEKIARLLTLSGITPGDRVLNYAPGSATSLELYAGTVLAGAIYVPVNDAYSEDDLMYFIDNAEPGVIVCQDASRPLVERCLANQGKENSVKIFTLNADGSGSLNNAKDNTDAEAFAAAARGPDDIAAILYTSGTTGRPKGVMHSHHSLASNAQTLASYWRFSSNDVLIHALPLFHLHGLFTATNVVLYSAGSMIYMSGFDADKVMRVMPQATVLMGVPPFYMALLKQPALAQAAQGMRLFISGSAPMLPQTHAQWQEATGHTILERYGMTEGSMIASNPYDRERRPNSVGFPLPGVDIRVVSRTGATLAKPCEIGFVEIKGENLFSGYWRLPEKTAEDMKPDGYFITGDYGMYDNDGYLHIVGRVKDAIVSASGEVIFPKEIEVLIDAVEGVNESAVIGVPCQGGGQAAIAIVVPSVNTGLSTIKNNIRSQLKRELAPGKIPGQIIFVDRLPRNVMGKVQKVLLREEYKQQLIPAV